MFYQSAYRQLAPLERQFVDYYVAGLERAAANAKDRITNQLFTPVTPEAMQQSNGLLEKPMVMAAINERVNDIAAAQELTPRRLVKEFMTVGFSSLGDYMDVDPITGKPSFSLVGLTSEQMAAIKSLEYEESERHTKIKIVLHDKQGALTSLARYMGIDANDNPHWKAETAKPVNAKALPADTTTESAANAYSRLINA